MRVLTHPVNRSESFIPIRKTQEYFSKWGKNSKRRITAVLQPGWRRDPFSGPLLAGETSPVPPGLERDKNGDVGWDGECRERKRRLGEN